MKEIGNLLSSGYFKENKEKKLKFFSYSWPVFYKFNSTALSLKESRLTLKFNWKKLGKTLIFLLLAIAIKSICQNLLGAEDTSLSKVLSALDYPFYLGCFLGTIINVFIEENWNNLWNSFLNKFAIRLDSGDENSGDGFQSRMSLRRKWADSPHW